jgi:hypothetical protein
MALLEDLMDGNERFECLHLVGEDWLPGPWLGPLLDEVTEIDVHFHALPERGGALVVPCVDNA